MSENTTPKTIPKKKADPRAKLYKPPRLMVVESSPHISGVDSVNKIMWTVIAALLPTVITAIYYFGWSSIRLMAACIFSTVITEIVIVKIRGKSLRIIDGSAIITGLLLALTLPPSFATGDAMIGGVVAIGIGKQIFGGLGYNIFNPALLGRAFLQASFPVRITTWTTPYGIDAVTTATPLGIFKFEHQSTAIENLFLGNISGSLGETCAFAIMLGGIFLLVKRYLDWRIPVSVLSTVFIFGGILWLLIPGTAPNPVFHLFSGGLMLGAWFMATDMVTSPITPKGTWIFGIGIGLLVIIIRLFGGLPEGVMYAILLMNGLVPLINRYTRPKYFGESGS